MEGLAWSLHARAHVLTFEVSSMPLRGLCTAIVTLIGDADLVIQVVELREAARQRLWGPVLTASLGLAAGFIARPRKRILHHKCCGLHC